MKLINVIAALAVVYFIAQGASGSLYTPQDPNEVPHAAAITAAANRHGVEPALVAGVCHVESRWLPDVISGERLSSAGAVGICQFMPKTADAMGVDPLDPASAFDGTARYLANSYAIHGNWREAIAAYNAGDPAVTARGESAADGPYVDDVLQAWRTRQLPKGNQQP